jgi:pyruvate dehydrogenase E2 component (dihydrolipoyllysine-residue acetyltransferase)
MPVRILMPALSPTMTEGTLAKWHVKEGDAVSSGDVIAEIETDKATMEVEAVDEGKVGKLLVSEGTEGVAVNAPIALLLEEGEDASALEGAAETAGGNGQAKPAPAAPAPAAPQAAAPQAAAPQASAPAPQAAPAPQPAAQPQDGARTFASPLARRMAKQSGIDLSALNGSGPHGRVVKRDIEAALAGGAPRAAAAPAAMPQMPAMPAASAEPQPFEPEFELQPLSSMRKTIAQRLQLSKQTIPHFYLTVDCEIDALLDLRKRLNDKADGAYKLSVNDLIIKICGLALRKVPAANASYTDKGIKLYKSADVAVAVAIDGGLITPIIRDAANQGLEAISSAMKDLAARARDGKLKPEEYQGGTFSISNLGMYGIKQFDAVINPPQGAILAIGAGEQRPVVHNGALAVATVMSCTLSCDHRAVDGAIGAEFLKAFKAMVEEPMAMLL